MKLTINSQPYNLIPLPQFQAEHNLPATFGVAQFEQAQLPFNEFWARPGHKFTEIQTKLEQILPLNIHAGMVNRIPALLANVFRNELILKAEKTELLLEDIDLTVTDFQNILEQTAYKLIELDYKYGHNKAKVRAAFEMPAIIQDVLDGSLLLSTEHPFTHQGEEWQVQVISTFLGPVGLWVQTPAGNFAVEDRVGAFPAADEFLAFVSALGQLIANIMTEQE